MSLMFPDILSIMTARDGGYVITKNATERGYQTEYLFAGDLIECMSYLLEYYSRERK